jgi:hypothetical protein
MMGPRVISLIMLREKYKNKGGDAGSVWFHVISGLTEQDCDFSLIGKNVKSFM